MNSYIKLLIRALAIALLAIGLTGCGETDEEKAEEAVEEYNLLIRSVQRAGIPSENWTDEKLNSYDAKLDRLDVLKRRLDKLDDKVGIDIDETGNVTHASFVRTRRGWLADARVQKEKNQPASVSTTTVSSEYDLLVNQMLDVLIEIEPIDIKMRNLEATEAEVAQLLSNHEKLMRNINAQLRHVRKTQPRKLDAIESLEYAKTMFDKAGDEAREYLRELRAKAAQGRAS